MLADKSSGKVVSTVGETRFFGSWEKIVRAEIESSLAER